MAELWHYTNDGQPREPVSREELTQLANRGLLKPADLVWTEGMQKWVRAGTVDGIFAASTGAAASARSSAPAAFTSSLPERGAEAAEAADDYDERKPRRRRERERERWEDDFAEAAPRRRGMGAGAKLGVIVGCVLAFLAVGGVVLYLVLDGGVSQPAEYSVSLNAQRTDARRIEFKSGKQYRITVTSDRKSDVDILIFDSNNRVVAGDESVGPHSLVTFAPGATGAFRVEIRNLGPGSNRSHVRFEETPVAQAPPPAFKRPDMKFDVNPPDVKPPEVKPPPFKAPPFNQLPVAQPAEYSVSLSAQRLDARRFELKAGKQYRITVTSERNSDVDILIFDSNNQLVAGDESIGPNSLVVFAPRATAAFRVEIRNLGPGDNRSRVRFEEMVAKGPPQQPPEFKLPEIPGFKTPPPIRSIPGKMILNTTDQLTLTDPIDEVRRRKCRCKTFMVMMQAGKKYHIVLERPVLKGNSIDPYLRLEDEGGKRLAENDDGGGDFGFNSYIFHQPTVSGSFRIIATTLTPRIGPFTLRVHEE